MNKYKVGDKFIVEIEYIRKGNQPYSLKLKEGKFNYLDAEEDLLDQLEPFETEPTMTAEEAWEISKDVMFNRNISDQDLDKIFGLINHYAIMRDNTPQEAKAKIKAWKNAKEIKVCDVVKCKTTGRKAVVTKVYDDAIYLVFETGSCSCHKIEGFEKTGEHIDIESVLKQLKPISDEAAKDRAEHFWEHRG